MKYITKLDLLGMGCNHLHEGSENEMGARGYYPVHLVGVDPICKMFHLSVESLVELSSLGAPRYWIVGDGEVEEINFYFHPAEFLNFLNDLVGTPNQWSGTFSVNNHGLLIKKAGSPKAN